MLPPPIARRSTPRAANASARVAIAPGSFFNSTTNCLAMDAPLRTCIAILAGDGSLVRYTSRRATGLGDFGSPIEPHVADQPRPEQPRPVEPRIGKQGDPAMTARMRGGDRRTGRAAMRTAMVTATK